MMYRVYVTDCLKLLTGASERYYDWVYPDSSAGDERTGEEIKADIIAGLKQRAEDKDGPV